MELCKQISDIKIRTLLLSVCCVCLMSFGYSYFFTPKYKFMKLSEENIENQWENIEAVLVASRTHVVPLLLFDIDILPNIFVPRSKVWKDTLHRCKVLCKHHPEEKNVITFAALATKFLASKTDYMDSLTSLGFTIHLTEVADPKQKGKSNPDMIPAYLWMARKKHVIHIAFLHERGEDDKYLWVGPVTDRDWLATVKAIAPAIGEGWHSLDAVGAKFPRYAQAYDLSHRFTGLPTYIDNHRISVPYHIRAFLNEYSKSRFIECNHGGAEKYLAVHQKTVPEHDKLSQQSLKKMLVQTKKILEKLKVPFWITGGSLLGWHRQCSLIPYDYSVDIAIWNHDYKDEIIQSMQENGFHFRSKLGTLVDGLEIAFLDENDSKLNMHFFKNEPHEVSNVRTREEDAMRFLFIYPQFVLCWSEFDGIKVQVPCETLAYITAYFGDEWEKPNKKWLWYMDAKNRNPLGQWAARERKLVMQIHKRKQKSEK